MTAAAEAIAANGLDGPRVLGIARDVARNAANRIPYASQGTREDLISYLVEVAMVEAVRYDPQRSKPGYSFASYLWDVMFLRVADFYRRKSEGFGDRRYGYDGRIVLKDDPWEDLEPELGGDPLEPDTPLHAAAELAAELDAESAWTVTHIAGPLASGWKLPEVAKAAGIKRREAEARLDALAEVLGRSEARLSA